MSSSHLRILNSDGTKNIVTSDNIPEGTTNYYATNTRVLDIINNSNLGLSGTVNFGNDVTFDNINIAFTNAVIKIGDQAGRTNADILTISIGAFAGLENIKRDAIVIGTLAGATNTSDRSICIGRQAGQYNRGRDSVSIGYKAGNDNIDVSGITVNNEYAIAIGHLAGETRQTSKAIAIGDSAGGIDQNNRSIAIGNNAGEIVQSKNSIAIGNSAGRSTQSQDSIAIGNQAGRDQQALFGVAIGSFAGTTGQQQHSIAIGRRCGFINQEEYSIAIGSDAGANAQRAFSIALGLNAGNTGQATQSVAIGVRAGRTNQQQRSFAMGYQSGQDNQGEDSVSVGAFSAQNNQASKSIAIGGYAGYDTQGTESVAIGYQSGEVLQDVRNIAIGYEAARYNQSDNSISIGAFSGHLQQGRYATAIGPYAGENNQGTHSVAIGFEAGDISLSNYSTAIGFRAGYDNHGLESVSIGGNAGSANMGEYSIAIGSKAGETDHGDNSVSIGTSAGNMTHGDNAVSIGYRAGFRNRQNNTIAIGNNAGAENTPDASGNIVDSTNSIAIGNASARLSQSNNAISIGTNAGEFSQKTGGLAIGSDAGKNYQQEYGIAIGYKAGEVNQGTNAIAIGTNAGNSYQDTNSIVINATGVALNTSNSNSLYISPIRPTNILGGKKLLMYDLSSSEVTYTEDGSINIGNGNIEDVSGIYFSNNSYITSHNTFDMYTNNTFNLTASVFNINTNTVINGSLNLSTSNVKKIHSISTINGNLYIGSTTNTRFNDTSNNLIFTSGGSGLSIGTFNAGEYLSMGVNNIPVIKINGSNSQGLQGIEMYSHINMNNESIYDIQKIQYGTNNINIESGDGTSSIAIGYLAGNQNQGSNAIAIGNNAGQIGQHDNTVVLNANQAELNTTTQNAFYVKPIRGDYATIGLNTLMYDTSSGEITYSTNTNEPVLTIDASNIININNTTTEAIRSAINAEKTKTVQNFKSSLCPIIEQFKIPCLDSNDIWASKTVKRFDFSLAEVPVELLIDNFQWANQEFTNTQLKLDQEFLFGRTMTKLNTPGSGRLYMNTNTNEAIRLFQLEVENVPADMTSNIPYYTNMAFQDFVLGYTDYMAYTQAMGYTNKAFVIHDNLIDINNRLYVQSVEINNNVLSIHVMNDSENDVKFPSYKTISGVPIADKNFTLTAMNYTHICNVGDENVLCSGASFANIFNDGSNVDAIYLSPIFVTNPDASMYTIINDPYYNNINYQELFPFMTSDPSGLGTPQINVVAIGATVDSSNADNFYVSCVEGYSNGILYYDSSTRTWHKKQSTIVKETDVSGNYDSEPVNGRILQKQYSHDGVTYTIDQPSTCIGNYPIDIKHTADGLHFMMTSYRNNFEPVVDYCLDLTDVSENITVILDTSSIDQAYVLGDTSDRANINLPVYSKIIDKDTLYAGFCTYLKNYDKQTPSGSNALPKNFLMKSTDRGQTWTDILDGHTGHTQAKSVEYFISDDGLIIEVAYIGATAILFENNEIRYNRSTDGGTSWHFPINNWTVIPMYSLYMDEATLLTNTTSFRKQLLLHHDISNNETTVGFYTTNQQLYMTRTLNNGTTWQNVLPQPSKINNTLDPVSTPAVPKLPTGISMYGHYTLPTVNTPVNYTAPIAPTIPIRSYCSNGLIYYFNVTNEFSNTITEISDLQPYEVLGPSGEYTTLYRPIDYQKNIITWEQTNDIEEVDLSQNPIKPTLPVFPYRGMDDVLFDVAFSGNITDASNNEFICADGLFTAAFGSGYGVYDIIPDNDVRYTRYSLYRSNYEVTTLRPIQVQYTSSI